MSSFIGTTAKSRLQQIRLNVDLLFKSTVDLRRLPPMSKGLFCAICEGSRALLKYCVYAFGTIMWESVGSNNANAFYAEYKTSKPKDGIGSFPKFNISLIFFA